MIFTYGYIPSYTKCIEQFLIEGKEPKKLGYREKYEYPDGSIDEYFGGGVWKTAAEAMKYIESKPDYIQDTKDWGVYILDACWDTDVYYIEGEPYHRLKVDKPIIGKHNV